MTTTDATTRLLTPTQVAGRCALSAKTVYRAIDRGELPAVRICSRIRLRAEDVDEWITSQAIRPRVVDVRVPHRAMPATNGLRALLEAPTVRVAR